MFEVLRALLIIVQDKVTEYYIIFSRNRFTSTVPMVNFMEKYHLSSINYFYSKIGKECYFWSNDATIKGWAMWCSKVSLYNLMRNNLTGFILWNLFWSSILSYEYHRIFWTISTSSAWKVFKTIIQDVFVAYMFEIKILVFLVGQL